MRTTVTTTLFRRFGYAVIYAIISLFSCRDCRLPLRHAIRDDFRR